MQHSQTKISHNLITYYTCNALSTGPQKNKKERELKVSADTCRQGKSESSISQRPV